MNTAIEVQGLTKRYGGSPVVDDVTFSIEQGETFALLGPNGAGKSTTVETLEGYRKPSAGTVRVLGTDPLKAGLGWRSRVGVVAQSLGADTTLTARELLTHAERVFPNARKVDDVLSQLGLLNHARKRIGQLSGGQKRRVDLALGIIGRPEVLFLDEPTTGLDPEVRRQMWDIVHELSEHRTTVLLTTHYLDEAEQLADRAGVIIAGRVVALDSIANIGGADARMPVVRWRDGDRHREERTEHPTEFVTTLSRKHSGEIPGLEIIRPTLEDIYLGMLRAHGTESTREEARA